MRALYLDTSAAAKLFQQEAESDALRAWLDSQDDTIVLTCDLTRTELPRALQAASVESDTLDDCASWLSDCALIRLTPQLCDAAGQMTSDMRLRSLDALHLCAAMALGAALTALVAYDVRLCDAARAAGLSVVTPT